MTTTAKERLETKLERLKKLELTFNVGAGILGHVVDYLRAKPADEKRHAQRICDLESFLESLLHPEELGWAVSQEVRDEAKRLLEA